VFDSKIFRQRAHSKAPSTLIASLVFARFCFSIVSDESFLPFILLIVSAVCFLPLYAIDLNLEQHSREQNRFVRLLRRLEHISQHLSGLAL
jgi:hypothetical protein